MRPRREAKPPRRPRVITWRLVLVSLVVGVVLAVVSVPVAAVIVAHTRTRIRVYDLVERFEREGHMVYVRRYDYTLGLATWWNSGSEPISDTPVLAPQFNLPGMQRVAHDSRPRDVRTIFDGQVRTAESYRAGFPFHSAKAIGRGGYAEAYSKGMWRTTVRGERCSIPYLPHWPGLLGNVLFYTLLVLTPLVLLRWRTLHRRARRGLCPACGYELGEGVSACPECGLARAGA
ncbi:MAG: zinc ribbon domain-containing protein [Phycisphaerales bacterium JB060]